MTNLTTMFHIDEQYLCPTTEEHINMQRAIFQQITKDKRFPFKENFRQHLLLLELVAVASIDGTNTDV
jgi:hypothetical protein